MNLKLLGKQITLLRKKYPLTQRGLEEKSGVTRNTIGKIERGEANPEIGTLKELADALNCDVHVELRKRIED